MRVLYFLAAGLAVSHASDPCTTISNCLSCVDSTHNCGWCSTNVIYQGGIVGTQCAGPHAGLPFTCAGIYSTEECVAGYFCDKTTWKCEKTKPGAGATLAECMAQCIAPTPPGPPPPPGTGYKCEVATGDCVVAGVGKGVPLAACKAGCVKPSPPGPTPPGPTPPPTPAPPAPVYVCHTSNYTCVVAHPGQSGATSKSICESQCKPTPPPGPPTPPPPSPSPSPPTPPGPPHPPTPPLPPTPPAARVYKCDFSQGKCFQVPAGTANSSSLLVCQEQCHKVPPPPGPPSGFKCRFSDFQCVPGGTETKESCEKACLGFYSCNTSDWQCQPVGANHSGATNLTTCEDNCKHDWTCDKTKLQCNPGAGTKGKTKAACDDFCVPNYQCQDDLTCKQVAPGTGIPSEKLCQSLCVPAWQCNVTALKCQPVPPSKGTTKARCESGCVTNYECNDQWQCVAVPPGHGYRNMSSCESHCKEPPPYWKCNYDTYQCDKVAAGSPPPATPNRTHCESICKMPPPTPGPPSGLKGLWRALKVEQGYPVGEWDIKFGDANMTVVNKDGVVMAGTVETSADNTVLITIQVGSGTGKVVKAIFQPQQSPGAEAVYAEFALGAPGGAKPLSVNMAMTTAGQQVFVMSKCLSQSCVYRMMNEVSARSAVAQQSLLAEVPAKTAVAPLVGAVNDPCMIHGNNCQV